MRKEIKTEYKWFRKPLTNKVEFLITKDGRGPSTVIGRGKKR